MKMRTTLIILLCVLSFYGSAQTYTIEKWYHGKSAASTLTFDDWTPGQGKVAIPVLKNRNMPASIYVTKNNVFNGNDYNVMIDAVDHGIEIGNHTVSHPNLTSLTQAQLETEVTDFRLFLKQQVPNQDVTTIVYPFGATNQMVINEVKKNHIGARIYSDDLHRYDPNELFPYEFASTEDDYFRIKGVRVNAQLPVSEMGSWIESAIVTNGLLPFTLHSVYSSTVSDTWFDPISDSELDAFIVKMLEYEDNLWICTFSDAVKYHREAHAATLSTISNTETSWELSLTDGLDNGTYNHPLSLRLSLSQGVSVFGVTQNNQNIPYSIEGNELLFDAIPDGGNIVIDKSGTSVVVSVNILSPTDNNSFIGLNPINLSANANVQNGSLSSVIFTIDGQNISAIGNGPYTGTWTPSTPGSYTLTATASATTGETASTSVNITIEDQNTCTAPAWSAFATYVGNDLVSYDGHQWRAKWWTQNETPGNAQVWEDQGACGGNSSPTVSLTSPSQGANFNVGTAISASAYATDTDGSISSVSFYLNNTLVSTDNSYPYEANLGTLSTGNYALYAIATDNEGATGTSATINFAVEDNSNQSPSTSITSPANNSTIDEGTIVSIEASASDPDGTIEKVEFYLNGNLLATDNASPYNHAINNLSEGIYELQTVAYDNEGATGSSVIVSITVEGDISNECNAAVWNPSTAYNGGALVSHNGHEWLASWWTQNEEPGTTGPWGVWKDQGACGTGAKSVQENTLQQVSIYPNPAKHLIHIGNELANAKITLANQQGVSFEVQNQQGVIMVEDLNPGIYILEMRNNNEVYHATFVKE